MSSDWQRGLTESGAVIEGGTVLDFGDPRRELRAARSGDVMADLSHFGLLRVGGSEAESFLQGQLTNDLTALADPGNQLSAWCSPQGGVLACMLVLRWSDAYYLLLPAAQAEFVRERLSRFVLRADVRIEEASPHLVRIGLSGAGISARIGRVAGAAPETAGGCIAAGGLLIARAGGIRPRYIALGSAVAARSLWDACRDVIRPIGAAAWGWLEIEAAIPWLGPKTGDSFLPQMIGLVERDGVSFTKGCYPGQEVVARTQHLGAVKRRLHLAHAGADSRPAPGDAVCLAADGGGERVGSVVAAEPAPDGGFRLLVVVFTSAAAAPLRLPDRNDAALALSPLPGSGPDGTARG